LKDRPDGKHHHVHQSQMIASKKIQRSKAGPSGRAQPDKGELVISFSLDDSKF
jgi:hypothetical protein